MNLNEPTPARRMRNPVQTRIKLLQATSRTFGLGLLAMLASTAFAQTTPAPGHFARDVVFDQPSAFTKSSVLLERLMSPRQRERQLASMAAKGEALAPYPLDFGAERFGVYLPAQQPSAGYGLLVFIPPWQDARLPQGWSRALDRSGVIFVTAARSGNDENIAGRRIPLALAATQALADRYQIDRNRIFIGGFSGGSRVALRTALAFPDVFSGVLLNAGSDPIANPDDPLPSPALLLQLQARTRFVLVTGENDEINLSQDAQARASLSRWCIDATRELVRPHAGHEIMDGSGLAEALGALDRPYASDPAHLSHCRATIEARLQGARADAAALRTQPQSSRIQEQLDRLEQVYGALLEQGTADASPASD